jgi:xylan 1,4-beta-xylosidase
MDNSGVSTATSARRTDREAQFTRAELPIEFQWLRTPVPEDIFSLTDRPGYLRLYGRESIGSHFRQSLVARRQEDLHFVAATQLEFAAQMFQQVAGLVLYYNATKFHYLCVTADLGRRQLVTMSANPLTGECVSDVVVDDLPNGPIELRAEVAWEVLRFGWSSDGEDAWREVPRPFDASLLSDEATLSGPPNFPGTFVGMACQDASGGGMPADFAWFEYQARG